MPRIGTLVNQEKIETNISVNLLGRFMSLLKLCRRTNHSLGRSRHGKRL
jgi:hypothetical protein